MYLANPRIHLATPSSLLGSTPSSDMPSPVESHTTRVVPVLVMCSARSMAASWFHARSGLM